MSDRQVCMDCGYQIDEDGCGCEEEIVSEQPPKPHKPQRTRLVEAVEQGLSEEKARRRTREYKKRMRWTQLGPKDTAIAAMSLRRQSIARPDGCIEWTGRKNWAGYGQISVRGRNLSAHRMAYRVAFGPIPDELVVDHLCRNRACINPEHLELVTTKENVLRGEGLTAVNARKTHCKHGHEFTEENTYVYRNGGRKCRECARIHQARYQERLRGEGGSR